MRLLLRSGDHSILRTPAPSCTLLPPTKQVEDRVFACAGRADPTPRPIWAMSALPPKADMCGAARDVRFGPKADIDVIRSPRWLAQAATVGPLYHCGACSMKVRDE